MLQKTVPLLHETLNLIK